MLRVHVFFGRRIPPEQGRWFLSSNFRSWPRVHKHHGLLTSHPTYSVVSESIRTIQSSLISCRMLPRCKSVHAVDVPNCEFQAWRSGSYRYLKHAIANIFLRITIPSPVRYDWTLAPNTYNYIRSVQSPYLRTWQWIHIVPYGSTYLLRYGDSCRRQPVEPSHTF